jgi:hypothetical protein
MPGYSFRVRFLRSPVDTVNIDSPKWEWPIGGELPSLVLCSHQREDTIKDSKTLVFKSDGWPSREAAAEAAAKYVPAFVLTLARLRVGADFGDRAPKSAFTREGLAMLERQSGLHVLNDEHGLMLYESEPQPRFVKFDADLLRGVSQAHFEQVFSRAVEIASQPTPREMLALDLFNASFFQRSADSRFLVLVMAIEALLDPSPRSENAMAHVESMIAATEASELLSADEKRSLMGSLKWLKSESINQAGRRLASDRLRERKYMEKKAPAFFSYCYGIRSRLVHGGHPLPTQQEIGSVVAQLEVFVSELLAGDLRNIELT